jgi:hypothetical protein
MITLRPAAPRSNPPPAASENPQGPLPNSAKAGQGGSGSKFARTQYKNAAKTREYMRNSYASGKEVLVTTWPELAKRVEEGNMTWGEMDQKVMSQLKHSSVRATYLVKSAASRESNRILELDKQKKVQQDLKVELENERAERSKLERELEMERTARIDREKELQSINFKSQLISSQFTNLLAQNWTLTVNLTDLVDYHHNSKGISQETGLSLASLPARYEISSFFRIYAMLIPMVSWPHKGATLDVDVAYSTGCFYIDKFNEAKGLYEKDGDPSNKIYDKDSIFKAFEASKDLLKAFLSDLGEEEKMHYLQCSWETALDQVSKAIPSINGIASNLRNILVQNTSGVSN